MGTASGQPSVLISRSVGDKHKNTYLCPLPNELTLFDKARNDTELLQRAAAQLCHQDISVPSHAAR